MNKSHLVNFIKIRKIITKNSFILALILFLGFGLRLINLGVQPFWGDEILSLEIVRHFGNNFGAMLDYLANVEIHPPLYYLMLHFWSYWFGVSEFAVRSLSVLFGTGMIWLSYYAGRVFFKNNRAALFAAFLIAVLPIQLEFSQQARPYIIFCFFGLLAMVWLWQYWEKKQNRYLFLFAAAALAGIYLHYSFAYFLTAVAIFWLGKIFFTTGRKASELMKFFLVFGGIFLGFFWWLPAMLFKISLGNYLLFNTPRDHQIFRQADFFSLIFSQLVWCFKDSSIRMLEIFSVFIFELSLAVGLIFLAMKSRYDRLKLWSDGKFYLFSIFFISAAIFLFSPSSVDYITLLAKHIIIGSVIFALLFGWLLGRLANWRYVLLLLFLFSASIINADARVLSNDSLFDNYYNLKDVSRYINENWKTGDMVLTYYGFGRSDLNYYLDEKISAVGIYPLVLSAGDPYYSRDTLGFLENESQLRIVLPPQEEIDGRIDLLVKQNNPKRVWVYGRDGVVLKYFNSRNWRLAIPPIGDVFPVSLYVRR
jgi:uncharacterized membrane protein